VSSKHLSILDGQLGVTPLSIATHSPVGEQVVDVLSRTGMSFWSLFWGLVPGGIGDTSGFFVLLGGFFLVYTGLVRWRILTGIGVGVFVGTVLVQVFSGPLAPPIFELPWHWHIVIGGLAFYGVFIASDPATSPNSEEGKWVYGIGIGVLTVCIRCLGLLTPEGSMLSILIMMLFTPLIDRFMIHYRLNKRIRNEL